MTADAAPLRGLATRAPVAALAAGVGSLALLGVAVAAAHPDSSPLSPDRAGGDTSWAWLYLGAISASFVFYLGGLAALYRRAAALAAVLVIAVLIQLAPLVGPVLLSTDVYTYWAYGRVGAVHGENPYEVPPSSFPDDPAYARMGADWRDTTTVYGPGFTLASEGVAAVVGSSGDAAAWIYRITAAAAMLVLTVLAALLARRRALACAFVGWNPLLAVQFAGGGHNDALMMAFVVGAIAAAAYGRRQLAGAAWPAAIAVKWVPAMFLALRVVEARATRRSVRHLGFAVSAAVLIGLSVWRYGFAWLGAVVPLAENLGKQTVYSIPHRLSGLGISQDAAAILLGGLFVVAFVWLLREAWRARPRLALAASLLLLATPWLVPWYAVWAVSLAAFDEHDRLARALALVISAYLLRDAVPL